MSYRIRGQEATLRVTIDGEAQEGSWFKVKDWTVTPRQDITESDYLGELESDLDFQHHGFDLSFSVDIQDRKVIDFLSKIVDREANQLEHPVITINVIYAFRANNGSPVAESYYDVYLKINDTGAPGRKEFVNASFEGKCKKRAPLSL